MEISEIKQKLSLAQVLQHYGLKPDKHHRLHCPFHADKTPSMQVYYKTQTCYCFSANCITHGKAMDVIDLILHKEGCSKHEALVKATELIGHYEGKVKHTYQPSAAPATSPTSLATPSHPREQVLQNMFMYFKNAISNSKPAQEYIQSRGLAHTKLEIGYNSGQFHHGTRKEETLIQSCLQVGLLSEHDRAGRTGEISYRPFAKHCIVFALRNQTNGITGLYFRSTVNHTDAKHFYLKESTGLYPGYPSNEITKLIIAESIIDAASLLQIKSITDEYSLLAAYGTNRLNEEIKSALISLQQLEEIIFAFDNDEAGNKAAAKYKEELQLLLPSVKFTKLLLPCKDVNETLTAHNEAIFTQLLADRTTDFFLSTENTTEHTTEPDTKLLIAAAIKKHQATILQPPPPTGGKHIKKVLAAAISLHQATLTAPALDTTHPHKLRYSTDTAHYYVQGGLPKTTDHLKIMLVIESSTTALKARNSVDLYEDKQVERLCKEVAEKLSLRRDLLEADLYKLTDLLESHIEKQLQQNATEQPAIQVLTVKERSELESFAKKPKLIKRLNELLGQTGIVGEERNRIFLLVIAISHKMPETLHALIQGSSGSGKTRLLKQISDCMPKESVTKLTRLSDKVLYNFPEHYFMNRLLCLEDIDGLSEEAEFAFRELQSNGELNSATSIKLESGQITSGQKTVKGPIASLACTTRGEIYEDNMSRVFLIAVDESAEQTKRIIEYQNKKAAGLIDGQQENETKSFIQRFVRLLKPYPVINPYAGQLQLPEEAHKIRRLNDLLQSFIKMVTIINQYQRTRDERGRLITAIEDIETAVAVMFESIILKVDELDGSLRQFYEQLKTWLEQQYKSRSAEFTLREVRHSLKVSKMQVFRYFNDLEQLEYVKQTGGHANRGFTYKVLYWDNYEALRGKIKRNLDEQVKTLKL